MPNSTKLRAGDRVRSVDSGDLGTIIRSVDSVQGTYGIGRYYVKWDSTNSTTGIHVSKLQPLKIEEEKLQKTNGTFRPRNFFDNVIIEDE